MFEIVAIVTMLSGTSPPLELTLQHPFESVALCEEFKSTEEFKGLQKNLESNLHFPGIETYKAGTLGFEYECREKK